MFSQILLIKPIPPAIVNKNPILGVQWIVDNGSALERLNRAARIIRATRFFIAGMTYVGA